MRRVHIVLLLGLAFVAGCIRRSGNAAPPKVETAATLPSETSTIVVPVTAPLADLETALNREAPRRLWQIDEAKPDCVPAQRVNLGIGRIKLVPKLGCRIVGEVTRGPITLSGTADRLVITMPVRAAVGAKKVGGVVSKTGTGEAIVRAVARLSVDRRWSPRAKVDLTYDWTVPPGIDILGQRIAFVKQADARLKPVVAQLERTLPRELAKLDFARRLDGAWRQGFTTIELNHDKPPAWMRITPRRLGFGGYRIEGRRLSMLLAAEAVTETFVGDRPADPTPTPLPPPSPQTGPRGLRFYIPVVADYAQLEPVILRALEKRAAKGITLSGIGPVDADFDKVTVYATTGNRLAVGVRAKVKAKDNTLLATKGEIWLTALPVNAAGSQRIEVSDLAIASDTDSRIANILVALFNDSSVRDSIRAGLAHDFAPDYQKVLGAARKAIGHRREGDFVLSVTVTDVINGALKVTGEGLFLPVRANGVATIAYTPRRQ